MPAAFGRHQTSFFFACQRPNCSHPWEVVILCSMLNFLLFRFVLQQLFASWGQASSHGAVLSQPCFAFATDLSVLRFAPRIRVGGMSSVATKSLLKVMHAGGRYYCKWPHKFTGFPVVCSAKNYNPKAKCAHTMQVRALSLSLWPACTGQKN